MLRTHGESLQLKSWSYPRLKGLMGHTCTTYTQWMETCVWVFVVGAKFQISLVTDHTAPEITKSTLINLSVRFFNHLARCLLSFSMTCHFLHNNPPTLLATLDLGHCGPAVTYITELSNCGSTYSDRIHCPPHLRYSHSTFTVLGYETCNM